MSKYKKAKTLKDVQNDPRVSRAFIDSDGVFIYLNPAFYNDQQTAWWIREDTLREALAYFNRYVRPTERHELARFYYWAFDEAPWHGFTQEVINTFLDEYEAQTSDQARMAVVARIEQYEEE